MRNMLRALFCLLIVACHSSPALAAEHRWWWPFNRGGGQELELTGNSLSPPPGASSSISAQTAAPQHPATSTLERRWMPESPLGKVRRPKIHLPEMSLPKPRLPQAPWSSNNQAAPDARNVWAQPAPQTARRSPLQTVKQGAQRVGSGTRAAWHKTVDVMTPGDSNAPTPQVATGPAKPSMWQRMFGQDKPPEQGPRTVTEWMAQDRLDP